MHAGEGTPEFVKGLRPFFDKTRQVRVDATRRASREVYIVCTGLK